VSEDRSMDCFLLLG